MKEKKEYGKIILSDNYYITRLDKYCLGLFRRIERTKKDTSETYLDWEIAGYHGDIENALYQAYKEMTKDNVFDKDSNIVEVMKTLRQHQAEMKNIFKNLKISL